MAVALSHDYRSLSRQAPPDPDIHSTLSDFLTYTEHFPAHLTRALSLIEDQRYRAEERIKSVHDDTTAYSILPSLNKKDRPNPTDLRRDISYALEEAENACRMAVEEAVRLDEMCKREAARLDTVTDKLKAQPLPLSKDPTPEPQQQALTSPNLRKERRMSTRAEDLNRPDKPSRKLHDKAATKLRGRKVMVPGEVLPPPDPNLPPESISDWISPRVSPPLEEPPRQSTAPSEKARQKTTTPRPRSRTPKVPKPSSSLDPNSQDGDRKISHKPRGPRAPGQPGTNAHSAVAGISTSNALLALTEPPADAPKGSKWLPWMKLTEWEMAKLRKRMKKNAIWVPSQTMVRRELKNLGRGSAGKEAARSAARSAAKANEGGVFVDEGTDKDPTKVLISGDDQSQITALLGAEPLYTLEEGEDGDADQELINRGMRLNEAKKLKRQRLLEEQALQAQLAREQGLEVHVDAEGKAILGSPPKDTATNKKRKRETTPASSALAASAILDTPDPLSKPGPAPKKLKLTASSKVPLAPAGPSSSPKSSRNRKAATPPAVRKPSLILKASKAVSEEPPHRRASLRRSSNASLPNGGTITSPNRTKSGTRQRNRKPAPGILTTGASDGESAKVGVSNRKAAPNRNKKSTSSSSTTTTLSSSNKSQVASGPVLEEPFEDIDPDEPRYCLCGDVSWGTMIACDNDSCEKEWFHLTCVGLEELPPRRTKWFCPDCRRRLKMGVGSNGLVGRR